MKANKSTERQRVEKVFSGRAVIKVGNSFDGA